MPVAPVPNAPALPARGARRAAPLPSSAALSLAALSLAAACASGGASAPAPAPAPDPATAGAPAAVTPAAVTPAAGTPVATASVPPTRGAPERAVRSDTIVVRVTNRHGQPLAIAVAQQGVQTPLGDVGAGGDARFAFPAALIGRERFTLVAAGNRETMRTAPFAARGGQVVWFDIVPGLGGSEARVRWPVEGPPRRVRKDG